MRSELFKKLNAIGQELVATYNKRAAFHAFENTSVIDIGDPVQEICRRAKNHDLAVIGHRTVDNDQISSARHQFTRNSIAAGLAHECTRPLLIVQGSTGLWKKIKLIISAEHINELLINNCIQMANFLKAKIQIICLTSGNHEGSAKMLVQDIHKSNPHTKDIKIRTHSLRNATNIRKVLEWDMNEQDNNHLKAEELLIIPTRQIGKKRITVFGSSPSSYISHAGFSTILLWPEEHPQPVFGCPEFELQKNTST